MISYFSLILFFPVFDLKRPAMSLTLPLSRSTCARRLLEEKKMLPACRAGSVVNKSGLRKACRNAFGWPSWSIEKREERKKNLWVTEAVTALCYNLYLAKKSLTKHTFQSYVVCRYACCKLWWSYCSEYRKNKGKLFQAENDLLPKGVFFFQQYWKNCWHF